MVKVKQINNLKIMQDKEQGCYLVITPEGKTVYKSANYAEVVRQCEVHKEFLTKGKTKENREVKIALRETEDAYTYYYVASVPVTVTNEEVKAAIQEGMSIIYALMGCDVQMPNVPKKYIEKAKELYDEYDARVDTYLDYVTETRGWAFKEEKEADIIIEI